MAEGWRERDSILINVDGIGIYRCRTGSSAVAASPARDADDADVVSTYYSTALPLLMQAVAGWEVFHASAVARQVGVIALCGSSEAGKTTIGYGLARRGGLLWADDAVAFRADTAGVRSLSLPFTAGLREESEMHFDLDPAPVVQAPVGKEASLRGVVIVEPGAEGVSIERLAPPDAIVALLPNAYRFRPATAERERQMVATYLELVAHVPVLRLRYAKDFARFDDLLDTISAAVLS